MIAWINIINLSGRLIEKQIERKSGEDDLISNLYIYKNLETRQYSLKTKEKYEIVDNKKKNVTACYWKLNSLTYVYIYSTIHITEY